MAYQSSLRDCLQYAWRGSGPRWDTPWIAIIGGIIGGLIFWRLGLKVPQTILENPLWGAVVAIVLGAVTGVAAVFIARLCWAPFHFLLKPKGGLKAALKSKLGVNMWPIVLMTSGVFAFVILFGSGAIWFAVASNGTIAEGASSVKAAPEKAGPVAVAYEVEGHLRALDQLYAALGQSGEKLYQLTNSIDLPWQLNLPWRRRTGFPRRQVKRPTVSDVKASIPQIQELSTLFHQMQSEINPIISEYPYGEYLRQISGLPLIGVDLDTQGLISAIDNLKPDENEDYLRLFLDQQSQPLVAALQRFREWFAKAKAQITQKRQAELTSLQKAVR
jgi:hypothetical protein